MYGVPDFYQNDNVKKGTGMQWRHQVVSDLPIVSDVAVRMAIFSEAAEARSGEGELVVSPYIYCSGGDRTSVI